MTVTAAHMPILGKEEDMRLRVTYMGRGYDASTAFPDVLELPADASVATALAALHQQVPDAHRLPASCLVVVSGKHLGTVAQHDDPLLAPTDELLLIAPVAGG
jgi:hypothetical protein